MKKYIRSDYTYYYDLSERDKFEGNYRKEKNFERLLTNNGYTIHGYHEYNGHTAYKIEKDGIVMEVRFVKGGYPKGTYLMIEDLFNLKKQERDTV